MNALAQLQTDFLRHLRGAPTPVAAALDASTGIAPALGLQIYGHAYGARLREALQSDHAALAGYLGADDWRQLCDRYIAAHPSRQRSLRHFGAALPAFLAGHRSYRRRPQLAELAAFERALLDSFDAADAPLASWPELLALPPSAWPALCPRLQPSLRRHCARSNGVDLWLRAQQHERSAGDGRQRAPASAAITEWAIWRDPQLVTRFRSLPAAEAALLDHFASGGDFAGGCERLLQWLPADEVPTQALHYLGQWCADGWISRWSEPAST